MIYKCPRFDERVKDGEFAAKRAINQLPTVSKSPLILFDRSRACNLIVPITNDPFVPQHSGYISTDNTLYRYTSSATFPKIITHTIIGGQLKNENFSTTYNPYNIVLQEIKGSI